MTGEPMHTASEMALHAPKYINHCLKSEEYEKYRRFTLRREAIMCYHQINTLTQRRTLVSP